MVKIFKGIPYTGTLPATLTGTKAGYLHGYKIYGNVGENLFDENSANIASGRLNTSGEVAYPDSRYLTSDYIEILNSDSCVIHLRSRFSSTLRNIFYAYYDESKTFLRYGQTETFRDGEINYVTQIPQNAVYIKFSYIGQNTPDTDTDVDIMLTKGSIPPESYIPFGECGERTENGYKLPLLSGSTPVDIYIGDTPLGTDEYVDYGEQKIYKRTENLFDFNRQRSNTFELDSTKYIYGARGDRPTPEPQFISKFVYNSDSFTVLSTGGAGIGFLIEVKPSTTYTMSFQTDATASSGRTSAVLNLITSDGTFGTFWGVYGDGRRSTFTTSADTAYVYLVFRVIGISATYSNIMLVEGSTAPSTYIPYLQPTDPPVPFPQIPTTANSTTISWAGQGLAPSEFDSIAEWVSATPKIYTNGAWTDAQTYTYDDGAWVADN